MIEIYGLNTAALTAELEHRRQVLARSAGRIQPRRSWWRRSWVSSR